MTFFTGLSTLTFSRTSNLDTLTLSELHNLETLTLLEKRNLETLTFFLAVYSMSNSALEAEINF